MMVCPTATADPSQPNRCATDKVLKSSKAEMYTVIGY